MKSSRAISAGKLTPFALVAVLAQLSSAQTVITDDFTDPGNWGPPVTFSPDSSISVTAGRMVYTCTSDAEGGAAIPRLSPLLPTTQDWSLQTDVHVDPFPITTTGQFTDVFLGFGKTADWFNTHVMFEFDRGYWHPGYFDIGDDVRVDGVDTPGLFNVSNLTSPDAALRLDYDAAAGTLTYLLDADGPTGGYTWVTQGTANLFSGTYNLNLGPSDTLTILLVGSSQFQTVASGQAYLDNLRITVFTPPPPFTWITNNSTITITGYLGTETDLTIPSAIYGLPVAVLGFYAFAESTNLVNVTIPSTVTTIDEGAFSRCSSLTAISIPNGVTSIGGSAFEHCTSLVSATIPASVIQIGEHQAFSDCPSLLAITVDPANSFYSSMDGVLFNKDKTTLIQYPGGKAGNYAIPDGVTTANEWAFESSIQLTEITLPKTLTNIVPFYTSPMLTAIHVEPLNPAYSSSDGIWYNKDKATLLECPQGKAGTYTLPNSVTNIGFAALAGCTNLTAINVDATNSLYLSVDGVLFNQNKTTLIAYPAGKPGTDYMVPDTVIRIGSAAFAGCPGLTNVTIPNTVTTIGDSAFSASTSLASLTIPDSVTDIDQAAFEDCASLLSIRIPRRLTSIPDNLFEGCTSLATAIIPASVGWIGQDAFNRCYSLEGVYFQGNAPVLSESVFGSDRNATAYYLPGTIGWGAVFGGLPTAPWLLPCPVILTSSPSFGVHTNAFTFIISWATNATVVVEACTSLGGSPWSPIATNTLTGGSAYFSDPQWSNHTVRFYRVRWP